VEVIAMKSVIGKAIILGMAVATVSAVGCSSKTGPSPSSVAESTGSAGFQLTLPGGVTINTVHVVISGPTPKTFDQDVSTAAGVVQPDGTVAINLGTVAGLAPGAYTVTISAKSVDGTITCVGAAAPFTVTAGATASVTAFASCSTPAVDAGAATITGDFGNCGRVNSLADNIGETTVGDPILISGSSAGPSTSALKFNFAASPASGGTFDPATGVGGSPSATFICATPGPVTITLTVSDGTIPTGAPACPASTASITVVCDPGATVPDAGATPDTGVTPDAGSTPDASSTPDTGTTPDTGVVDAAHEAEAAAPPPPSCTDTHCAVNNGGSGCTATELLLVEKDTDPTTCAAKAGTAFGCYDCLVNAGCLDDSLFATDVDHECGDTDANGITNPTLNGDSATASCLATVSCVLGPAAGGATGTGNCATANGSGNCYCGNSAGQCVVAGKANGPCISQETDGLDSTDPVAVNSRFVNTAYAAGMANTIFACAGANTCTQCFP
jgi:hypothetical protein